MKLDSATIGRYKGFTLMELLVVIAVLAILLTITIVAMNPAEIFAQARDTQRITDMEAMQKAIELYVSNAPGSANLQAGAGFTCGTHFGSSASGVTSPFAAPTLARAGIRTTDGNGWIAIDFDNSHYGAPFGQIPEDPTNSATSFYAYSCDQTNKKFELDTNLESAKFRNGGENDLESNDTGNNSDLYEIGSDPGLDL
ncbi:MAG: type II secretion system protein [Candidatus Paceibacterota bacterium]